jgi:hypothetical protein
MSDIDELVHQLGSALRCMCCNMYLTQCALLYIYRVVQQGPWPFDLATQHSGFGVERFANSAASSRAFFSSIFSYFCAALFYPLSIRHGLFFFLVLPPGGLLKTTGVQTVFSRALNFVIVAS